MLGELGQRWKAVKFRQVKGWGNWINVDIETHDRIIGENVMPQSTVIGHQG